MKVELVDLNYDICSKEWKLIEKIHSKYGIPLVFEGILKALYFTINSLKRVNIFVKKKSVIFLVGTYNQHLTLSKVAKKTNKSILLGFHNFKSNSLDNYVPSFFFYFAGWVCFPYTLLKLFQVSDRYQRIALIKKLERLLVSGVSISVWRVLFRLWKPSMIVISNDHNHWTRSAVRAAEQLGIQTLYIPHAYTSDSFPELECSYSFLDSDTQLNLYKKKNPIFKGVVKVVGAVRYEDKINQINYKDLRGILICFNKLDSTDSIESILKLSLKNSKRRYSIFAKPHPGDIDRFTLIKKLCKMYKVIYISPYEDIYNYSHHAQVLLGGVTGAHIDALMYGMLPVSFSSWYLDDYYGLLKEDVVQLVDCFADIHNCYKESFNRVLNMRHKFNSNTLTKKLTPSQIIANEINNLRLEKI